LGFRRLDDIGWMSVAGATKGVAQRKPGSVHPPGDFQAAGRYKERARHGNYLVGCMLTDWTEILDNPRLETLRRLLADDPANTFARYGLAMEHVRSGDLDGAVQEFEAVLTTDPNYSAAYYHGGQALEKLGKLDQARDLYRRGIAATRDPHALSELQAALDILGE
jgi:tetratricopeptide (TPR) repeat protein